MTYIKGRNSDINMGKMMCNYPKQDLAKMNAYIKFGENTVKTLYNVTLYNRIFNIQHIIAGNGFVSIKIPSL